MTEDSATWPFPSDSRQVRALLSSAEGLCIGGVLVVLFDVFVLRVVYVLGSVRLTLSAATVTFGLVGVLLFARWLGILSLVHPTPEPRNPSPVVRDWREAREWRLVAAIALLVLGAILGATLALRGWKPMVTDRAVALPGVGVLVVGLLLHVYCWRRLGEF